MIARDHVPKRKFEQSGLTETDAGFISTVDSDSVGKKDKKLKGGRRSEKKSQVLVWAQTQIVQKPQYHRPWGHLAISNPKRNNLNIIGLHEL